ncbi:MAG: BON domain-containing protein [Candidatus Rokubacteria bacterium]|nr:BON domain-containing protein [Candidatus Rokubacteria bacterium]
MRCRIATSVALAAVMLAGAPAYTLAQSTTDKPSTTERLGQKADEAGSKVKSMAREGKTKVTDSWVTSKTKIALFADERVKGRQISVETKGGTVMLRGKVDSEEAKAAASEVTKRVEHVKDVHNQVQVGSPGNRPKVDTDDKAITSMVKRRLKEDRQLKSAKIDARVDSGIVTLTGEVKSLALSSRASEVLSDVPGVRAVRNDLSYEPRSSSPAPAGGK